MTFRTALSLILYIGMLAHPLSALRAAEDLPAIGPLNTAVSTQVSEDISQDAVWTAASGPYVLMAPVRVLAGTTLTIEPGTIVKLSKRANLQVEGTLIAGTETIFADLSDDRYGNTSHLEEEGLPATWNQVHIAALGGGVMELQGARILLNGNDVPANQANTNLMQPVRNYGGSVHIKDSAFGKNLDGAVYQGSGTMTIARTSFGTEEGAPDVMADGGSLIIEDTHLAHGFIITQADLTLSRSSVGEVVCSAGTAITDGGGNIGPIIVELPRRLEQDLSLNPYPFVYTVGSLTIPEGRTMFMPPGSTLRSGNLIEVYGSLVAGSETGEPVVITSLYDTSVPGGKSTRPPFSGDAPMILAREGSSVSFANVSLRYGRGNGWLIYDNPPPGVSGIELGRRAGQIANAGGRVTIIGSDLANAGLNHIMQFSGETSVERTRFSGTGDIARVLGGTLSIRSSSLLPNPGGLGITEYGSGVSAEGNWWGDASGPHSQSINPGGRGPAVSEGVAIAPWLSADPFAETGACAAGCASNVLFLPGIKGSRLYGEDGNKLWEPFGDHDVEALMLDPDGKSIQPHVHAKTGDIIDTVAVLTDIYGSYMDFMDGLVEEGTINAWTPVAYDWRLSLPDIVNGGTQDDDRLSYTGASDAPYIRGTLEGLASSSKTGKVTIVAHSNGGLVAKQLMLSLGDEETARLVDKVIFVGVPQSGAPQALGALLYGYKEGLPWWFPGIVSTAAARQFAENSPMGYHLLPSSSYFRDVDDETHAVARFDAENSYQEERGSYGSSIDSYDELRSFALALDGGREKPHPGKYWDANVLNERLLDYAEEAHADIDAWTPPAGVSVYQIAGWGEDTIAGIEFKEFCVLSFCKETYDPILILDGDGVVPVPSALMLSATENVKRYWLNLRGFGFGPIGNRNHGNIFAVTELQDFIQKIFLNETESPPSIIRTHEPVSSQTAKRLRFFLHSPLTLELIDSDGNRTGPNPDGSEGEDVPDAQYGQFGEVQYISAPAGTDYRIEMHGYETGTFTFEVEETDGENVTSVTFADVPTTEETVATIDIGAGLSTAGNLEVDIDGNGSVDAILPTTLGEVVAYETSPGEDVEPPSSNRNQRRAEKILPVENLDQLRMRLYVLLLELLLEYLQAEQPPL